MEWDFVWFWSQGNWGTGLGKKAGPRLCECCRQGQAKVIRYSRNKVQQTWGPPSPVELCHIEQLHFWGTELVHLSPHLLPLQALFPPGPGRLSRRAISPVPFRTSSCGRLHSETRTFFLGGIMPYKILVLSTPTQQPLKLPTVKLINPSWCLLILPEFCPKQCCASAD